MAEESATDPAIRIARLAERQHGVVCVTQLYALGLSKDQVSDRVRAGWLHRLHRGIYAVGHRNVTDEGVWMAAVLACGGGALLSHEAAAQLWKLRRQRRGATEPVDVIVPRTGGRRRRRGIVAHRVAALSPAEATLHCRIPVTTPARTILDLATILPRRQVERAMDEAERLKLCTEQDLIEIARVHSGRRGAGALGRLLANHAMGATATQSELEERFLALCRVRHLPQPEVNVPLLDYIVDFHWPATGLVVEVDGRESHATHRAFQADRDRDGRLAVAGYRVVRFTWWDITRRPAVVADRIRRLLRSPA